MSRLHALRQLKYSLFFAAALVVVGGSATASDLLPIEQSKASSAKAPRAPAAQMERGGSLAGRATAITVMANDPLLTGQREIERVQLMQPTVAPAADATAREKPTTTRTIQLPQSKDVKVVNKTDRFVFRDLTERDDSPAAAGIAGLPLANRQANVETIRRQSAAAKQSN